MRGLILWSRSIFNPLSCTQNKPVEEFNMLDNSVLRNAFDTLRSNFTKRVCCKLLFSPFEPPVFKGFCIAKLAFFG